MVRVGLIGALDSVKAICEVSKEYSEVATFKAYTYDCKEDTLEIVKMHLNEFDAILLSGRVPYNIATSQMEFDKPIVYVPHNGSCIYRTLWDIKSSKLSLEQVSFDTINEQEIREIYKELGIDDRSISVFEYDGDIDYEILADFHKAQYAEHPNHVAVTCLLRTHDILKEMGIPVFRVNLTKSLIRQVVETAIYEANSMILKANQIAVVILDIDDFKKHISSYSSEYEIKKLKLRFHELLLDYAKIVEGSVFNLGTDKFLLFTTGGALEAQENTVERQLFVDKVAYNLGISVSMGIGYGKTAYEAEIHAKIGVKHAKACGGNCIFVVDRLKNITGPLSKAKNISYSYQTNNSENNLIATQTGLSVKNIQKIQSIISKNGDRMTSKELSFYLNMTERSARRILTKLNESGYAQIFGEENSNSKGRPRIIYQITL